MRSASLMALGSFVLAGLAGCGQSKTEPSSLPEEPFVKAAFDEALADMIMTRADACGLEERALNEWGTGVAASGHQVQEIGDQGVLVRVWSANAAELSLNSRGAQAVVEAPAYLSFERNDPARLYTMELRHGTVSLRYDGAEFSCEVEVKGPVAEACETADLSAIEGLDFDSQAVFAPIQIAATGATPGCSATQAGRANCRLDGEGLIFVQVEEDRRVFQGRAGQESWARVRGSEISCESRAITAG